MNTPDPPILPLHRIAVFAPGRQSDEELKASFIARQPVLDLILEDIASTRIGGIPQHHLIIGQRGMGKTTLLRRLDVALRAPPHAERFIPLSFPEEQWTVDRLSSVWMNCLDSLADTLERESIRPDLVARIDATVERLHDDKASDDIVAQEAEKAFLELATASGRLPVLLVDNLDIVFGRLAKHELNVLRAVLMKSGAPILIGASIYPPEQTQDYSSPFYDQFKTHYLGRLSLDEMRDVLLRLAERAGNREIPTRIDAERGRLRALHALTGGNPRTTVILFQIFAGGFSQEAYQDLEALLDWMTPLYKARFEELSDQAQVVVSAIASIWEPATSARICERTRLQNSQVSTNLDRLKKAGIIEEVIVDPDERVGPLPAGRSPQDRTGYQLAERFFNIWFLMRQATRRDKRNLTFLTRFIECVHTPEERDIMARALLNQHGLSREQRIYGLALESAIETADIRYELHDHVQSEFIDAKRRHKERIDEIIDPAEIPLQKWALAELRDLLIKAIPTDTGLTGEEFADAVLSSPAILDRRQAIASAPLDAQKVRDLMQAAKEEEMTLVAKYGADAVTWFQKLLRGGAFADPSDPAQASEAFGRADTRAKAQLCKEYAKRIAKGRLTQEAWQVANRLLVPDPTQATALDWLQWGNDLVNFSHYPEAENAYREAIKLDPKNPAIWHKLGRLLQDHLERYDEAESAYRKAIDLDVNMQVSWNNLGNILQDNLGRMEEAELAYRKAIELNPKDYLSSRNFGRLLRQLRRFAEAETAFRRSLELDQKNAITWWQLGHLLHHNLKQYNEAESAYRKAIGIDQKDADVWHALGNLLQDHLGRYAEAESAYRNAIELAPRWALPWINLGLLLDRRLHRHADAENAYHKAIDLDPKNAVIWWRLGDLLQDKRGRYNEAESAYRKALELDSKDAYAWDGLGNVLQDHLGRYSDSEVAYRNAAALAPKWALPWDNLGRLFDDRLHRYDDAEASYRKAIEIDPTDAVSWWCLGNLIERKPDRYDEAEAAYRKAIELDPKNRDTWNSFGLFLGDCLGRGEEAAEAFRKSASLAPEDSLAPNYNLVSVLRDQLGAIAEAQRVTAQLPASDVKSLHAALVLHPALFAAYADNWGEAQQYLGQALDLIATDVSFPDDTYPAWKRTSAVLLHLGFGEKLLTFLRNRGEDQRRRPWFEALRALVRGDRRYLRNIPAEIQETAGQLYDEIALRLKNLPQSTRADSKARSTRRGSSRRDPLP